MNLKVFFNGNFGQSLTADIRNHKVIGFNRHCSVFLFLLTFAINDNKWPYGSQTWLILHQKTRPFYNFEVRYLLVFQWIDQSLIIVNWYHGLVPFTRWYLSQLFRTTAKRWHDLWWTRHQQRCVHLVSVPGRTNGLIIIIKLVQAKHLYTCKINICRSVEYDTHYDIAR